MRAVFRKGIIREGRVEVDEPINLPDGSEVTVFAQANGNSLDPQDEDRPMTPAEIRETLEAMSKIEPFDMTDEERTAAETWENKVNEYSIANLDKGLEEVFR